MQSAAQYRDRVLVICTYDWTDKKDVLRVRQRLREIGYTEPIYYKTDEMTRKGIYGEEAMKLAPCHE